MSIENTYNPGEPSFDPEGRLIVISGCSGGGKSTLIQAMSDAGFSVFPEAGRQVVREETALGGDALPWVNVRRFAERCIIRSVHFHTLAQNTPDHVLFDRCLLDNVIACAAGGIALPDWVEKAATKCRFSSTVFMVPPWQDIFETDDERQHDFAKAVDEYNALLQGYSARGYQTMIIPKMPVHERVEWLENEIAGNRGAGNTE